MKKLQLKKIEWTTKEYCITIALVILVVLCFIPVISYFLYPIT